MLSSIPCIFLAHNTVINLIDLFQSCLSDRIQLVANMELILSYIPIHHHDHCGIFIMRYNGYDRTDDVTDMCIAYDIMNSLHASDFRSFPMFIILKRSIVFYTQIVDNLLSALITILANDVFFLLQKGT